MTRGRQVPMTQTMRVKLPGSSVRSCTAAPTLKTTARTPSSKRGSSPVSRCTMRYAPVSTRPTVARWSHGKRRSVDVCRVHLEDDRPEHHPQGRAKFTTRMDADHTATFLGSTHVEPQFHPAPPPNHGRSPR